MGILILLAGVVLLVVVAWLNRRPAPGSLAHEGRQVLLARAAGLILGVGVAWLFVAGPARFVGDLGRAPMLAPLAVGVGVLAGVIVGEIVVRRPDPRSPRAADLATRRIRDHLPPGLGIAVGVVTLLGLGVLAYTTATASPDDLGRTGRQLFEQCTTSTSEGRGPYPGSFYSVPLIIGLGVAHILAAYAARRAVLRPRGVETPGRIHDLRRQSVTAVVAGLGVAVAAPMVGIGLFTAAALLRHQCPPAGGEFVGVLALALLGLALGTTIWSIVLLVSGATPTRATARTRATAPSSVTR